MTIPAIAPPESLVFLLGLFEPEPDDPPDDPPEDPPEELPDPPDEEPVGFGEDPFEDEEPESGEGLGRILFLLVGVGEGTSPSSTLRHSCSPASCASIRSHQLQPSIMATKGFPSPLTESAIKSTSALNTGSRSLVNDSRIVTLALIVSKFAIRRFCNRGGNA